MVARARSTLRWISLVTAIAALVAAWALEPSLRALVLAGGFVLACLTLDLALEQRPEWAEQDPSTAGDSIQLLAERGQRELGQYLERHAAFAAYLDQHQAANRDSQDNRT